MLSSPSIPTPLRLRWWGAVTVFFAVYAVTFYLLRLAWMPAVALQWSIFSTVSLLYILAWVWHHLPYNHRAGQERVLATIGFGSTVTLARGCLYGLLAGFVLAPKPEGPLLSWLPGGLFLVAALTDYIDGYLARRTNHATQLGKLLDLEVDSFGVLVATILLVQYGQLPAWYLIAGSAHYLFHYHLLWRKRHGLPVHELADWPLRRYIGGFHVGFLCVLMFPVFEPPLTTFAAVAFLLPFAYSFGSDWLRSTGRSRMVRLDDSQRQAMAWSAALGRLVLRLAGPAALVYCVIQLMPGHYPLQMGAAVIGFLLFIGVAARPLGLLVLGVGAWYGLGAGLTLVSGVTVATGIYLFLFDLHHIASLAAIRDRMLHAIDL
jgi:CDP-diacylglycerol---glycerol-3-phosphate 3-phosphatidyltransferase